MQYNNAIHVTDVVLQWCKGTLLVLCLVWCYAVILGYFKK